MEIWSIGMSLINNSKRMAFMKNCRGQSIGQPIVGCDCKYCYPLLRQWYKETREKEAPDRIARFKFVKAIIKSGIPIDDNGRENDLITKWNEIIDESPRTDDPFLTKNSSIMTSVNIIKVPAILTRLKLYIPFDGRNIKQETKDRVREIWNSLK